MIQIVTGLPVNNESRTYIPSSPSPQSQNGAWISFMMDKDKHFSKSWHTRGKKGHTELQLNSTKNHLYKITTLRGKNKYRVSCLILTIKNWSWIPRWFARNRAISDHDKRKCLGTENHSRGRRLDWEFKTKLISIQ